MKVAFFSTHEFEKEFFITRNLEYSMELKFFDLSLNSQTAPLAKGFPAVCCFVSDQIDEASLKILAENGVRLVALRSAGYNNVDLAAAERLGILVVRVPGYSPHAVAEHAVALLLCLNRKIHKAYARVRDLNFSLDGFVGFDLRGKTVGVIGTGRIGSVFAHIMKGFSCELIAYDKIPDQSLQEKELLRYVALNELYQNSDIISLHLPLSTESHHLIDQAAFARMKPGVVLINTSRGALIDSPALVQVLKSGHLGGAALDVYEEEEGIFFKDLSDQVLRDDILARLLTFPNVLLTSHQGFLTKEALSEIARVTLQNISDFREGRNSPNEVHKATHVKD